MFIIFCTAILILFLSIVFLLRRGRRKKILLTGLKSTGKTTLINFLSGQSFQTVPSLISYTVLTSQYELTESREANKLKDYDLVIILFKNELSIIHSQENIIFVSLGSKKVTTEDLLKDKTQINKIDEKNIFYLNDELENIKSIIRIKA